MLRDCTETENKIIKESRGDILTYPELYAFANRKGALPFIIGIAAGLALSSILTFVLKVGNIYWATSLFVLCNTAAVGVAEFTWQKRGFKHSRKAELPGTKFRVNGGVVLNYIEMGKEEAQLTIAEDDLRDKFGHPLCIRYPAPHGLGVSIGQRILLAYSDNGAYIPIRITERTKDMIPPEPPAYFRDVEWDKTMKLPHPAALELDKKSYLLNEQEIAQFVKSCNSLSSIKAKNWIGIIVSGLSLLMILGLVFIFVVAADLVPGPIAAIAVAAVLLTVWVTLTLLIAKAALSGAIRGMKTIRYRKNVIFLGISTFGGYRGTPVSYLYVYEYVDGTLKQMEYLVGNNVFLPKDIPYGSVIYKYTKETESKTNGLNYFVQ